MHTTSTKIGVASGAMLGLVGVVLLALHVVDSTFDWFWGVWFLSVGTFFASAAMGLFRGQRNNP